MAKYLDEKGAELICSVMKAVGENALSKCIETTHSNLLALKNRSNLVPGQMYRITDYQLSIPSSLSDKYSADTTASRQFDIIVTAVSTNRLSEQADAYFHGTSSTFGGYSRPVNAWKLWYCIDNDTSRFEWADTVNGKGVIYRMIDELNNDLPYDFKHLKMKPLDDASTSHYYTFGTTTDYTAFSTYKYVHDNRIEPYVNDGVQKLNNIQFNYIMTSASFETYGNVFGAGCYDIIFKTTAKLNTFGPNCCNIWFYSASYENTFGANCTTNTFNGTCYRNTFSAYVNGNMFAKVCTYNSFGSNSYNNWFYDSCSENHFMCDFFGNKFNGACSGNIFGTACYNNTFNGTCSLNSFGNNCNNIKVNTTGNFKYNTFNNGCTKINIGVEGDTSVCQYLVVNDMAENLTIGVPCTSVKFGPRCKNIILGSNSEATIFTGDNQDIWLGQYSHNNTFGMGCSRIYFMYNTFLRQVSGYTLAADEKIWNGMIYKPVDFIYSNTFLNDARGFEIYISDGNLTSWEGFSGNLVENSNGNTTNSGNHTYEYTKSQITSNFYNKRQILNLNGSMHQIGYCRFDFTYV